MTILQYVHWDLLALLAFCLINISIAGYCVIKLHRLRNNSRGLRKRIHELEDDVKTLYSAIGNIGDQLKVQQEHSRILKEQQEQLSLKEPSQQSYRNAIQQIRSGDSTAKIVETSGLSRGEVELLRLLNAKSTAHEVASAD